jgi:hypothetical protein
MDAEEAVKKYTDFLGWLQDEALLGRPPAYRSAAEKEAAAVRRSRSQNLVIRGSRQRYEHMRQHGEWPEEDSRWSDEDDQTSLARYTESEYSEYDQWE